MKTIKYTLTLLALVGALAVSAKADLMFLGAQPFGPNNNPDTNKAALEAFLGHPVGDLIDDFSGSQLHGGVEVTPGEFFVCITARAKAERPKVVASNFLKLLTGKLA